MGFSILRQRARFQHSLTRKWLIALFLLLTLPSCAILSRNRAAQSAPAEQAAAELSTPPYQALSSACDASSMHCYAPAGYVAKLPPFPLQVTEEVRHEMRQMLRRNASFVRDGLSRRNQNHVLLARIFDDEGVPRDLLNLAMIESGFRKEARSCMGAIGMWQFMKQTGRNYGLSIGPKEDQRKDLVLSTIAAARHLRDLFIDHGDWYLALAAYNAGPATIARATQRSGSDSFWVLARSGKLPRQTARFVPKLIAAAILARTADRYGLQNLEDNVMLHIAKSGKPGESDTFAMNTEEKDADRVSYWPGDRRSPAG